MKEGSAGDPFEEDSPDDGDSGGSTESAVDETPAPESRVTPQSAVQTKDGPPYVLRRKRVKEDREMVQFFLREEFGNTGERQLKSRVEDILDTEVSKLDLREAAYAFAQENPEEVAALLREWGYEYR